MKGLIYVSAQSCVNIITEAFYLCMEMQQLPSEAKDIIAYLSEGGGADNYAYISDGLTVSL